MSNLRYYNQSGPLWDFVASLEGQDWSNHPFLSAYARPNNQNNRSTENEAEENKQNKENNEENTEQESETEVEAEAEATNPEDPFSWGRGWGRGGGRGGHRHGRERRDRGPPGWGFGRFPPHFDASFEHPPPPPPFDGAGPPPPPFSEGRHRGPPPPEMAGQGPPPPEMVGQGPPPPNEDEGQEGGPSKGPRGHHHGGPPRGPPRPHHGGPGPHHGGPPKGAGGPGPHHGPGGRHPHGFAFGGPGPRGGHRGRGGCSGGGSRRGPGGPSSWGIEGTPFNMANLAEFLQSQIFGDNATKKDGAAETGNGDFVPPVDIFDGESAYVIHVSLPGAKKEDIAVSWDAEKSEVSITGVIHRPGDEEFLKTLALDERKVGVFERKVMLGSRANPALVEAEGITAKLEDGILRLNVPKQDKEYEMIHRVEVD